MEAILWNLICSDIERFRYEKKIMFRLTESKQIKHKKNCTFFIRAINFQKLSCFSSKIIANLEKLLKNYERFLIIPEEKQTNLKKLIKSLVKKSFIFPVKCRVFWFF